MTLSSMTPQRTLYFAAWLQSICRAQHLLAPCWLASGSAEVLGWLRKSVVLMLLAPAPLLMCSTCMAGTCCKMLPPCTATGHV